MYHVLRNLLFCLPAETSHELSLEWLAAAERLGVLDLLAPKVPDCPVDVMGLRFPNPVGLAAGLDKNADAFNAFGALGFGFVEVGTVTPRPQPGNPRPRLFRLPAEQAIINRMGFNNKGLDHLVARVQKRRFDGVLGINIGKNFDTPLERAVDDYLAGMDKAYPWADYLTVNVSSPNTPGLRSLQFGDSLAGLLTALKQRQESLSQQYERYVPIAIKIAPDMSDDELKQTADALVDKGMDAVVATNTTLSRQGVEGDPLAAEAGGLSGAPLTERSTAVVATLAQHLDGALPVIAVGGICSGLDAAEKIRVGASLVQIYTGFIYQGPGLVREAVEAIRKLV